MHMDQSLYSLIELKVAELLAELENNRKSGALTMLFILPQGLHQFVIAIHCNFD